MTTPANASDAYKQQIATIAGITRNVLHHSVVIDGVTDTSIAMQACLDSGPGDVIVPYTGSNCIISSTISVPSDVTLIIQTGAVIECTANVNAIEIEPQGFVKGGGTVYISNVGSTSACLSLDANLSGNYTRQGRITGASDINLKNAGTVGESGIGDGVRLKAYSNSGSPIAYVEWTSFTNINITNCENSIFFDCLEDTGNLGFINSNHFTNIFTDDFVYGVKTVISGTGDPAIAANVFSGIAFQCDVSTISAIHDEGRNNNYTSVRIWDFIVSVGVNSVNFVGHYHYLLGEGFGLNTDYVKYNSRFASVIITTITPMTIPTLDEVNMSIGAGEINRGQLVSVYDKRALAYCIGSQWNYIGGPPREVSVTVYTGVTVSNCGVLYNNLGATGTVACQASAISTMPGTEFIVRRDASFTMIARPNAADNIAGQAPGKGAVLESDGAYIHLKNYAPNVWHIVAQNGTITFEA